MEHAAGAGHSVATLFVDELDVRVAAIFAARGLEPDELEIYPKGVRKVVYREPEGPGCSARKGDVALVLSQRRGRCLGSGHMSQVIGLS